MPFLLIGLLALVLVLHAFRELGRASPLQRGALRRALAAAARRGVGLAALAAAAFMTLRGEWALGALLGACGYYLLAGKLLAFSSLDGGGFGSFARAGAQPRMTVLRTRTLEATLDAGGVVDGVVARGNFAGSRLSELSRVELNALRDYCAALDRGSLPVIDAYIDRRLAGGRHAGQRDAHPRWGERRDGNGGEMSEQQAYETLGVEPGASAEEITRAHRRLMKERHPDHGGSTDDAARLNQAKDRLMRRHG